MLELTAPIRTEPYNCFTSTKTGVPAGFTGPCATTVAVIAKIEVNPVVPMPVLVAEMEP
jgi:hypothetical protein